MQGEKVLLNIFMLKLMESDFPYLIQAGITLLPGGKGESFKISGHSPLSHGSTTPSMLQ